MHTFVMFHVPPGSIFPSKPKVLSRLRLWLEGKPEYTITERIKNKVKIPVCLYQLLKRLMLPFKIKQSYRVNWCPIYRYAEKTPGINLLNNATSQFEVGYNYIKQQVNYTLRNKKLRPDSWGLSYWFIKTLMGERKNMS